MGKGNGNKIKLSNWTGKLSTAVLGLWLPILKELVQYSENEMKCQKYANADQIHW